MRWAAGALCHRGPASRVGGAPVPAMLAGLSPTRPTCGEPGLRAACVTEPRAHGQPAAFPQDAGARARKGDAQRGPPIPAETQRVAHSATSFRPPCSAPLCPRDPSSLCRRARRPASAGLAAQCGLLAGRCRWGLLPPNCTAPASPRGPRATCGRHTHGRLAEPVEVHAQVRFDAVHGAGQSDASQEQGEQHHVGHGGRDPHDLGRGRRHGLPGRPGPGPGREVTLTAGAEGGVASGSPHTPNGHRTPAQQMPAGARRSALCDSGGLDQDRRFGRDVTFLLPFGLSQQA